MSTVEKNQKEPQISSVTDQELLQVSEELRKKIVEGATIDGELDKDLLLQHLVAHTGIHIVKIQHIQKQFVDLLKIFNAVQAQSGKDLGKVRVKRSPGPSRLPTLRKR